MEARISFPLRVSGFLLTLVLCQGNLIDKPQISSVSLENSPISHLDAIIGGTILLPCDVTPPTSDDSSILVLFYRGENKTPIYSVDSRESSLANGIHWSADYLGQRAFMNTHSKDSGIVIKDVQLSDRGSYRCRVDFLTSPTRNSRIQLRVIEPPRRMSIVSNWDGERKAGEVIGPYPEDSEVTLSCQVIGGIPSPRVTWWQEGSLLDDVSEVTSEGVTRNTLHLPKLTRADLLKVITCQAVNSNLTAPLTRAVTIDLAYPPSSIRITSTLDKELNIDNNSHKIPMTVTCISGQKCPLQCRVEGSRPPPLVTWKSNGRTLESEFETISSPPGAKERGSARDSSFYSTLMLTATPEDNGAMISCRASSPALTTKAIEDNVKLNVLYKPQLKLTVNEGPDLLNVEEGEDLQFECDVKANPEVTEIHWTRNWIPLVENSSSGIHISKSGSSLHLKKVTRASSGHYACAAANSRGAGTSNAVLLSIKFSPKCSTKQVTSVGIGKSESANVTCRVDAHPTATIFRWAFNSSEELIDIPFDQQIEKNDSSNTITYQPRSPFDFGDLLCWASNSVGTMKEPCIIKILPIDKPEGVRGCKVTSNGTMTDGMVIVTCLPGWDGGLAQSFTLEVRKAAHVHARILAALQHSSNPVFHLRNLLPGQEYLLTITSANPRGTSPSVTLSYTPPEEIIAGLTKKHSDPESTFMKFLPFIAIFVALIVVLTTCVSIIACIARSRAADKALEREVERRVSMENRKGSVQHSLPPDRGKEELDDVDEVGKDPSEHYCAVHGHERRENEYISYKHYFNNIRDDTETQHLLKSSVGGSSGMDNQLNACSSSSNSRDSSSSCGIDRHSPKETIPEYPCDRPCQQRYSEGSFRGLAPLASVDSLSGFSTISNHSSTSKKTENSSQKSFRAIPEVRENNDCTPIGNGFLPRPQTSTLPSIKITPFTPVFQHSSVVDNVSYPTNIISFQPSKQDHYEQTVPNSAVRQHSNYSPIYSTYSSPCGDVTYCQSPPFPPRLSSPHSLNSKIYEVSSIPSLPPPSISTHPMFINDSLRNGKFSKEDKHISSEYTPERKLSRESSV